MSYIKEPYFPPGKGYRYSNTNYLLMAMIIEKVTGSNLSTEFREQFWHPLAIENAFLSIQEKIPDNQAHVFGDNFNNDGSNRDLTFLPRASHESMTFGSAGLFMTAVDLARWCHALFEGRILNRQSMKKMLDTSENSYGLGVGSFGKFMGYGEKIVGHCGANIGTSVYMVHLPDYHFSVVVMINGFDHDCSKEITRKITGNVLRELEAIGTANTIIEQK
ncbi:beta-lactamase family protein [candidate division KSB1 bacterium]|nr:beta-lactamase family protein [candidate division KSB1 bacterium]